MTTPPPYHPPAYQAGPSPGRAKHYPYRPARLHTIILLTMLGIMIAGEFLNIGASINMLVYLDNLDAGVYATDQEIDEAILQTDIVDAIAIFSYLGALIVTGITWCLWQYRQAVNVRGLGATDFKISPGWGVGYWFIPILSLFRPLMAISEIWRAAEPDAPVSDFRQWQKQSLPPLLLTWWLAWVIGNGLGYVSGNLFLTSDYPSTEEWRASSYADIGLAILGMGQAVLAIFVVYLLSKRIIQRHEQNQIKLEEDRRKMLTTPPQQAPAIPEYNPDEW